MKKTFIIIKHQMYFQQRNVYNSKIRKLSDLLSLLLDWQLPGLSRSNDAFVAQASQATSASEGSSDSMGGNDNNIINSNNNNGSNEMKTNDINDDGSTLASSFLAHYGSLITDMAPRYGFESMTFLFTVASCLGGKMEYFKAQEIGSKQFKQETKEDCNTYNQKAVTR